MPGGNMKFNYRKIFLLGFGFFGVSVIWGVYNAFVPIFLANEFHIFKEPREYEEFPVEQTNTVFGFFSFNRDNKTNTLVGLLVAAAGGAGRERCESVMFILFCRGLSCRMIELIVYLQGKMIPDSYAMTYRAGDER